MPTTHYVCICFCNVANMFSIRFGLFISPRIVRAEKCLDLRATSATASAISPANVRRAAQPSVLRAVTAPVVVAAAAVVAVTVAEADATMAATARSATSATRWVTLHANARRTLTGATVATVSVFCYVQLYKCSVLPVFNC